MNSDFHRLDAGADSLVERMLAKFGQIRVFGHPFEIAVTQVQRAVQCRRGQLKAFRERITASQVVVHRGIGGAEPGKLLVHSEPLFEPSTARVIVAQDLEGINVRRIALDDAFQEADLDVETALLFAA